MAEVFRAEVVEPGGVLRTVAVKLMKRGLAREAAQLFALETELLGLLEHPNLPARLEAGEVGGRPFFAMEDVFGGDLVQLLRAHRAEGSAMPLPVVMRIAVELTSALAYVHAARDASHQPLGLVHGDVSPANVLLSATGDVKLADFGVARSTQSPPLPSGAAIGKLHYFSPEQANGQPPTALSDIFSAGVVLFELCMGFRPFDGVTDDELLEQVRACHLEGPAGIVDPELAGILRRALARNPEDRPPTAGAFCGELTRYALDTRNLASHGEFRDHVATMLGVLA